MAMEERKGVQVWFILLEEVDPQKAYDIGVKAAEHVGGTYNSTSFYTLGNPVQYKQALNIFVAPDRVGEIVSALGKDFGLTINKGYIYVATPGSQYVPRSKVNPTVS
ncbi:MAG: hypothetical protein OK456_05125 [Thaumarchaeota archaeon]|nr:hypothetical protein [Nitrososphaerota archaeon]